MLDHLQTSHSTQQVSLEHINTFAISSNEYMRVLSKELTAKRMHLKMDTLRSLVLEEVNARRIEIIIQ